MFTVIIDVLAQMIVKLENEMQPMHRHFSGELANLATTVRPNEAKNNERFARFEKNLTGIPSTGIQ
jgi:hypothetical protein